MILVTARYSDGSLFRRVVVIPKVRILRRFVIPKVPYSEGLIVRKQNKVH